MCCNIWPEPAFIIVCFKSLAHLNMGMDMYEKEWPMEGPDGWRLERVVCNLRLKRVKEVWYLDKNAAKKEAEEEKLKEAAKTAAAKTKASKEAAKKIRKIRTARKGPQKSKKRELLQKGAAKKAAKQETDKEAAKEAKNNGESSMKREQFGGHGELWRA